MSVTIRKLSDAESAAYFGRPGAQARSAYVDALRELDEGDAAEITLGDVSARATKSRLSRAAKQLGLTLTYAKTPSDGVLYVRVQAAKPVAAARRPRGRPPKSARA